MLEIDWSTVFDVTAPEMPGADESAMEIFIAASLAPFTELELDELAADVAQLATPDKGYPESYLSFLRWSNGGSYVNGERHFDFFSTGDVRDFLLGYRIPVHLPGTMPFAFDGGANFYLFDMRHEMNEGEFPIVFAPSCGMSWDKEAYSVADSFLGVCRGRTDIAVDLWSSSG